MRWEYGIGRVAIVKVVLYRTQFQQIGTIGKKIRRFPSRRIRLLRRRHFKINDRQLGGHKLRVMRDERGALLAGRSGDKEGWRQKRGDLRLRGTRPASMGRVQRVLERNGRGSIERGSERAASEAVAVVLLRRGAYFYHQAPVVAADEHLVLDAGCEWVGGRRRRREVGR